MSKKIKKKKKHLAAAGTEGSVWPEGEGRKEGSIAEKRMPSGRRTEIMRIV